MRSGLDDCEPWWTRAGAHADCRRLMMKFRHAVLESLDYALPETRWTSEEIEERLKPTYERLRLPAGRLELMTGIRERRVWEPGTPASAASTQAGRRVLEKSGIPREKIDLVIHAAVSRDRLEPATAAYVHGDLGLGTGTQFFDVSNACLGFLNALSLAAGMIDAGQIRSALVVAGENGRPLLENTIRRLLDPELTRNGIKPYFANLTIGCGAVAAVICHDSLAPDRPRLLAGAAGTDTRQNRLCEGDSSRDNDGLEMRTESEALLLAGVALAKDTWRAFKQETGWDENTPDRIICHQVGAAHRRKLYETLNLSLEKDFSTFASLGNIGSVSLPITLARAVEEGAVKDGHRIALLGIGSGITSLMLALDWRGTEA